jgi:ectoine hydroxylase-related dioxygenase (phytanoyl-CoA dioxygenase family)
VPHDTITCWIALDPATLANGCLRYIPKSHRLGLIDPRHLPHLLTAEVVAGEVAAPAPAGACVLHHGLTLHSSGRNTTPERRRGWALHYVAASSRDLSLPGEASVGTGQGTWECLSVRGGSYDGCV